QGEITQVILPTSSEKVLDLCDNQEQMKKMTVMQVKKKITEQLIGPDTDLRLVFGTQTLEDLQLLSSYGIKHLSIIRTLLRVAGGTR
uniref:Ubiquitin-like domain-containing protein n=1 Tax=Sphaeramia orbicularis TaxID=375764 RepID=A0A672ZAY2_9TELE